MRNSLLRSSIYSAAIATALCALVCATPARADDLEGGFTRPPQEARPWVYWFWTNNVTSKDAISHEVEWLKAKGFGGAQLTSILRNVDLKGSPTFMSEPWRELFVHAVREMERCGLDLAFNPCNGWNMGGPWITASPQHACRVLTSSRLVVEGPRNFDGPLPAPEDTADYRDTNVIAFPLNAAAPVTASEVLQNYTLKASKEPLHYAHMKGNSPDMSSPPSFGQSAVNPLETAIPEKGASAVNPSDVVDLTEHLDAGGRLRWQVPVGRWMVIRMGHYMPTSRPFHLKIQSTPKDGKEQLVGLPRQEMQLDFLSAEALDRHFDHTVRTLIQDDLKGRPGSLKYVHTESFETGLFNWTEQFIAAFRSYRGYDPTPFLPALSNVLVGSPEVTERFLYDYRKTRSDLFRDGHYAWLLKRCRELGVNLTGQNGGPCNFIGPMDALELLGLCDAPQGEWRPAQTFASGDGRTFLPLRLAPHGSVFVVLRKRVETNAHGTGGENWPSLVPARTLEGPWEVRFDPQWGGPQRVVFDTLTDWTERPEPGIRFYSGQAIYRKTFDFGAPEKRGDRRWVLDLGDLKQMASVRLNGRELGIVWASPRQVDITRDLVASANELEIAVVNTWLNRIAGDYREKDQSKRWGPALGRGLYREDELVKSGLLGPVRILAAVTDDSALGRGRPSPE